MLSKYQLVHFNALTALKGDGRRNSHWSTALYAQNTPTGKAPSDQPFLDLRRPQKPFIRRHNSNIAIEPPTTVYAFERFRVAFRTVNIGPIVMWGYVGHGAEGIGGKELWL